MDIQESIKVMQAFEEGKPIQSRFLNEEWKDNAKPSWNWEMFSYRVKPEPILPKTKKKYNVRIFLHTFVDFYNVEAENEKEASELADNMEYDMDQILDNMTPSDEEIIESDGAWRPVLHTL